MLAHCAQFSVLQHPIQFHDNAIILTVAGSVAGSECKTLDSTWINVTTEPNLPVQYKDNVTLPCLADHVNKGGNKATCLDGELVPTTTPPRCSPIGV